MRNLTIVLTVILGVFSLFGCEKDAQTFEDFAQIEQQDKTSPSQEENTEIDNYSDVLSMPMQDSILLKETDNEEIESRSGLTKIYGQEFTVRRGYFMSIRHEKQNLDPNCKYVIKVTRYNGDPDLFVYAGNYSRAERKVRRATFYNDGREETYAYRSDLLAHESYIHYLVFADGNYDARFKIEIFKDCSDTGGGEGCSDISSNCEQVSCTPSVFNNDGTYGCTIRANFSSNYRISHWEVNGERKNTTSSSPIFTVYTPGDYTICCYFWCNGNLYKCCQIVTCPPNDNQGEDCCNDDVLNQSWVKDIRDAICSNSCKGQKIYCATYQGRSVIHITPWEVPCTDGAGKVYTCDGDLIGTYGGLGGGNLNGRPINTRLLWDSTKDCGNNSNCNTLLSEDFQSYQVWNKIAAVSNQWETWERGREGSAQDAYVMNGDYYGTKKHLHLANDRTEDVIYKLGNRRNGRYELSFQMNIQDAGYFNIQKDQYNRVSGGLFGVTFFNNGTFQIKTNGGGRSSTFSYPKNQWIDVKLEADFSRNSYKITIAGRTVNITSAQGFSQLGAINFYAIDNAAFSVDNIVLQSCN